MVDAFGEDGDPARWEEMTKILPGVYLGDAEDAKKFTAESGGVCVCVHENTDSYHGGVRIPIMVGHRKDFWMASRLMMDAACAAVRHYQRTGIPVLLHCHGGVERSPLTMAWFLKKYGYCRTLPEAYELIRSLRPIVQDRLHWLQPKEQK